MPDHKKPNPLIIGRIVHYRTATHGPQAAIITRVLDVIEQKVHLTVFPPGSSYTADNVCYAAESKPHTWGWPQDTA